MALIAYYSLDGDALDRSGNGNTLSLVGSPSFVTAQKNQGIQLDGATQSLVAATSAVLDFTTQSFSITGWFKRSVDSGTTETIIRKNSVSTSPGYSVQIDSADKLQLFIRDTASSITLSTVEATLANNQYFFAGVFDRATNVTVYLYDVVGGTNTIRVSGASTPTGSVSTAQILRIGRHSNSATTFFPGILDEIRFYNHALTQEEITQLYNNGLNKVLGICKASLLRSKCSTSMLRSKAMVAVLG